MYGLIKSSKLADIGALGALAIAFYSASAVLYIMLTGSNVA